MVVGGKVISRELRERDRYILVRKLCLWTGGIQPARMNIRDNEIPSSTLSLTIYMCGPYGANYDGEEMMMYSVYYRGSVRECI